MYFRSFLDFRSFSPQLAIITTPLLSRILFDWQMDSIDIVMTITTKRTHFLIKMDASSRRILTLLNMFLALFIELLSFVMSSFWPWTGLNCVIDDPFLRSYLLATLFFRRNVARNAFYTSSFCRIPHVLRDKKLDHDYIGDILQVERLKIIEIVDFMWYNRCTFKWRLKDDRNPLVNPFIWARLLIPCRDTAGLSRKLFYFLAQFKFRSSLTPKAG